MRVAFVVVGEFIRPGIKRRQLHLPIIIDENIKRSNIADFLAHNVKALPSQGEHGEQIPDFALLEKFLVVFLPAADLILQREGKTFVGDLDNSIGTTNACLLVGVSDRVEDGFLANSRIVLDMIAPSSILCFAFDVYLYFYHSLLVKVFFEVGLLEFGVCEFFLYLIAIDSLL